MRAGDGERLHAEVASVLDWWTLAGVTTPVQEHARDWLAPAFAKSTPVPAPQAEAALPATLDDLLAWLATGGDDALLGPLALRLAPRGDRTAKLMVLVDMPGAEDAEEGTLLSGPAGRLLDRMLAAIGATRDAVWLASLSPSRPAGGRIAADRLAALGAVARHHAALIAPDKLLIMGSSAAEAVLGRPLDTARGLLHDIDGRKAIATFSPQVLLGAPLMKAAAWADLRQLIEGDGA